MRKQSLFLILTMAASTIGLTACSTNEQSGALIGSLVGAGIGKSTSNHRDKRAAIGAVLGGMVGGAIGQDKDRRIANSREYATTSQYSDGSSHSHGGSTHTHQGQVSSKASVSHKHGNRTHSHPGGAGTHQHTFGNTNNSNV